MAQLSVATAEGERRIQLHDGGEADAVSIIRCEEYDLRQIRYSRVARVVDIGAGAGVFALVIDHAYPGAEIHCFEPLPATLELLRRNLGAYPNIRIHPVGLSSSRSQARLWLAPRSGHGEASTTRTSDHSGESQQVTFLGAAEALEDIAGEIAILKIDTEGHELRILRSLAPQLERVWSIFLEVHSARALADISVLLSGRFLLIWARSEAGHRYRVLFANCAAIAAEKIGCAIAPEIYDA